MLSDQSEFVAQNVYLLTPTSLTPDRSQGNSQSRHEPVFVGAKVPLRKKSREGSRDGGRTPIPEEGDGGF